MTTNGIEAVISRAMSDNAFAELLFSDLQKAITGFELTPEEVNSLRSMSRAEFEQLARISPEERKSFLFQGGGWDANHNE